MSARHQEPYDNVMEMVGWTPLIRLHRVTDGCRTPVFAKCEFMSPGGSVKDRIGLALVEAAEQDGTLRPGGVIVEATSGNTGMALAMAATIKGYRCIFTMPDKMSQEKVKLLRAFGAEVIITPTAVGPDHPDHYLQTAKRIAAETLGRSWPTSSTTRRTRRPTTPRPVPSCGRRAGAASPISWLAPGQGAQSRGRAPT